jgi:hypothetical protein
MRKVDISVSFDLDALFSYTDSHLAALHHLCQMNPAGFGDMEACDAAERVKAEIVQRWLAKVPPEMFNHQWRHVLAAKLEEERQATKGADHG